MGWNGAGCDNQPTCTVTLAHANSVTARFDAGGSATTWPLAVAVNGTGSGTVTSAPSGISCTSLLCYDATHGHPVGGGAYWMAGFDSLTGDIRQHTGRPVVLAGEGCGEAWLPYLDLMLSLQVSRERYNAPDGWESIPFFQAVYHACAVTYGNYSSLTMPPYDDLWPAQFAPKEPLKLLDRKFSRQFYLEQARAFAWGQQPTVANFQPTQLEQRPEDGRGGDSDQRAHALRPELREV
jgi:hypothetical protein